jgi:hypothetical protein
LRWISALVGNVGEPGGRATEHTFLQGHALAEADVANDHVTPTPGAWMDASEVPEPARGRQSRGRVDISQLMNLKIPLNYGRAFQDNASVQCGMRSLAL